MSDDTEDLLDFGKIDVYYVVWPRDDKFYYLKDTTPNLQHIQWTAHRGDGLYLYTESEAKKLCRVIKRTRPNVQCDMYEIDVLADLNVDEL